MEIASQFEDFILGRYSQGVSIRTIAKEIGLSTTPVKKILKRSDVNTKRNLWDYSKRKFNKSKEWLEDAYRTKNSYQIAKELNMTQAGVHFWIRKYGLKRKRVHHEETKEKIRNTLKEKFSKGILVPNFKGRPLPEHVRRACIEKNKLLIGELSHRWKGGITPKNKLIRASSEYVSWRNEVFMRDDYTCQHCFKRGGNLEAHHIKPFAYYPELRLNVDNGLTLCNGCHNKTKNERWSKR